MAIHYLWGKKIPMQVNIYVLLAAFVAKKHFAGNMFKDGEIARLAIAE